MMELERLWVCHECQMIGTAAEGKAHKIARGHKTVELSDEESQGVRNLWMDDRNKRAAGFMLAARRRGPFAAVVAALEDEEAPDAKKDGEGS